MTRRMKQLFLLALGLALLLAGAAFYIENATLVADIGIREETVCDLSDLAPETELTVQVHFFCAPEAKIKPVTLLWTDGGLRVRFNENRELEIGRGETVFARDSVLSATGMRRFTLHCKAGKMTASQVYCSPLSQMPERPFAEWLPTGKSLNDRLHFSASREVQIPNVTIRKGNRENMIFFLKAFAVFFGITAAGFGTAAWAGRKDTQQNTGADTVCFAAICTFGSTAFLLLIAAACYFPEVRMPDLSGLLIFPQDTCPEPKEHFLYLLALPGGGLLSFLNAFRMVRGKMIFPGAQTFAVTVLLIFCGSAYNLNFCRFPGSICGLAAAFGTAMLLTFRQNEKFEKSAAVFCGAAGIFVLAFCGAYLFRMPCTVHFIHHYCAVVHSLYLAAYGYIPFADFQSQYGLYALFLAPFFRILPVSLFSINLVFLLLVLFTGGAFLLLLRRSCRNRFLPFLGTSSILAVYAALPYLQQMPVRTVFPALMLLFVRYESDNPSAKLACLGTALGTLSLLWSPDTGAILLVAHTFFLGYLVWEKYRDQSFFRKTAAFLTMMMEQCLVFAAVLLAVLWTCKLLYGRMPDLRRVFQYSMIFGKIGYFSLPMPNFGFWLFPAAIYCSGLCFSFVRLFSGEGKDLWKGRFVFFCSLLGCGIASYYVGRSHDNCLLAFLYPAIVLLTIFADSETGTHRLWRIFLLAILFFPLFRALILLPQHRFTKQEREQMADLEHACSALHRQIPSRQVKFLGMLPFGTYYAIRLGLEPLCGYTSFEECVLAEDMEGTLRRLLYDRSLQGIGLLSCGECSACPSMQKIRNLVTFRSGQKLPENAMLYLTLPMEPVSGAETPPPRQTPLRQAAPASAPSRRMRP